MNNNLMNSPRAQRGLVAALAFMLPFLSLVTLWGVSLCSFLFLIAVPACFKPCRSALARRWPQVRWVAAAFLFNFLFAAFCLLTRTESTSGAMRHLRAGAGAGLPAAAQSITPALAGMLVVSSYFCLGLTEVIFWSVKASLLYALMVFPLMGLCLNTKENDGN